MSDKEFLETVAKSDSDLDHSIEKCGLCFFRYLQAEVARELLERGDPSDDVLALHHKSVKKRWQESKYVTLWNTEKAAGRDPREAFKELGWEP